MARALRAGVMVLTLLQALGQAFVCAGAATGLLFLLRPYVSGLADTSLSDALPLDELPAGASIPFAVFVAVWAAVAMSVAVLGPRRRTRSLTFAFPCAVWLWEVAGTTASLFVVRQTSILHAFTAALAVPAVHIAALLAGLAAGLARKLGTVRSPRHGLTRLHTNSR